MERITLAALAALSLVSGICAASELRPRPGDATLKDDERSYPRVGVESGWYPTHTVGDGRYRVDVNTVSEVTGSDESKHRRASAAADYHLRWLGAAEGIAFLVADLDEAKVDPNDPESNRRFYRLELGSMKWLDPFKLPEPSIDRHRGNVFHLGGSETREPQRHVLPQHLILTPQGVVVLCEETIECLDAGTPEFTQYDVVGYHVSCYGPKDVDLKWDRAIRRSNRARRSVGYSMRWYDDSIERLTYVAGSSDDNMILACPSERDAVVCLAAADGKVCWRIPAIWEYERGFIGPSVFEHYIERFGMDYMTAEAAESPVLPGDEEEIDRKELRQEIQWKMKAERKLTAARDAFYARYQGRITAGPIVIADADGRGTPKAYVAAVRSLRPDPGCAEQPEHAFIYEIEPSADYVEFTGMTRLPRAVIGRPYCRVPGGIVLSCDRGSMVRLRTYEPVFGGIMGPGSAADDLILQIDWYREFLMRCPSAWFMADPPADVAGLSKVRLFRPGRGYVRAMEDKVYHLQINVVDLRTGVDHDLTLSVPFEGELPIPKTGVSSFNLGQSTERLQSSGPHAVWIDRISVNDGRLTIAVAHGSDCTAVTFDLSALLADD